MIDAFIYGAILALGLIVPLGVQNIFIFNQGATQPHFLRAMPSVFTAAVCDTALIILAVLGISLAVLTLPWLKTCIYIGGFFFLMIMGWVIWNSKPTTLAEKKPLSIKHQIGFSASVSLLNPHALLDTVGVIGTNSLNFDGIEKWIFTIACIFVSFFWFIGLSIAGHFLHRFDQSKSWLAWINKLSALIIWSVAFYLAYQIM